MVFRLTNYVFVFADTPQRTLHFFKVQNAIFNIIGQEVVCTKITPDKSLHHFELITIVHFRQSRVSLAVTLLNDMGNILIQLNRKLG